MIGKIELWDAIPGKSDGVPLDVPYCFIRNFLIYTRLYSKKKTPSKYFEMESLVRSLFNTFDLSKTQLMSKISKAFLAFGLIIRNPWLLNKVMEEEGHWKDDVANKYGFHHGLPVIRAEELFGDFSETVDPFAFLDGGSLPTDLALLKKLARGIPHCSYFEIGTWRGESVVNVASVAEICYTLDLSACEMRKMGLIERYIDLHGYYSKNLPNIHHLEGNTLSFDFRSLNRKFNLIFIDGDHHFDMVKNDTEKVFGNMIDENSIVVWHDYAHNPETIRYEVLAGILHGSPASCHRHIFHVAHTLCAVYLPGKTGGERLDIPVEPSGSFKIDIRFNKGN
jgi:predicted O-methyltransferase YrrM